ncbi:hypothetical protein EON81_04440 [bacterium]|nr:MAG: hypothetical protein EON81_04440 [bacterium]
MLETPLYGKFQGERRLVFLPPAIYLTLVRLCIGGGLLMFLYGTFFDVEFLYPQWWQMIGLLVAAAGGVAAFALQSVTFDFREKTYSRRQGPGMFPKWTRGRLEELDAVVLIAEPNSRLMAGGVTYHLMLHWKGVKEPPMVLQQDTRVLPGGMPLNYGAAQLLTIGGRYAKSLGVSFYDNSHFPSSNPAMPFRRP